MTKISNLYSLTNYLTVDTVNGRIGIGTASPTEKLHFAGASNNVFLNEATSGNYAINRLKNSSFTVDFGLDASGMYLDGSTGSFRYFNGSSQRFVIGSDGAMGFNYPVLGSRSFMFRGLAGRVLVIEAAEAGGIHSLYLRPNASGRHLISSNYLSGGVYLPLALSGRENDTDFVLATNGNVGIGVASPTGQLSLKNQISNGTSAISSYAATNGVDGQNFFNSYYASGSDGSGTYPRYFDIVAVGSPDGTNGGSNIRFFTNPTGNNSPAIERVRITSGGTLGINGSQDVNNAVLDKISIGHFSGNYGWIQTWNATSLYLNKIGNAVYAGSARIDNNSDARIKDNIQPITGALDKVLSMNGKTYHMLDEPESKIRLGFIAQELQGVVDELVIESDRSIKLPTGDLIENVLGLETWGSSWAALLVEAMKELKTELDAANARIQLLESK